MKLQSMLNFASKTYLVNLLKKYSSQNGERHFEVLITIGHININKPTLTGKKIK